MSKNEAAGLYELCEVSRVLDSQVSAVEIAVVSFDGDGYDKEVETYVGVAHMSRPDSYDEELGYDLAFWRAVGRAANKHIKRAEGRIKHNDDIRELKAEQLARRQETAELERKVAEKKARKAAKK